MRCSSELWICQISLVTFKVYLADQPVDEVTIILDVTPTLLSETAEGENTLLLKERKELEYNLEDHWESA